MRHRTSVYTHAQTVHKTAYLVGSRNQEGFPLSSSHRARFVTGVKNNEYFLLCRGDGVRYILVLIK